VARGLRDHGDVEPSGRAAWEAPPLARHGALLPRRHERGRAVERGACARRRGGRLSAALLRGPGRVRRGEPPSARDRAPDDELGGGARPPPRPPRGRARRTLPRRLDDRGPGRDRRPRGVGGTRGRTRGAGLKMPDERPLVSVVVPLYNEERVVPELCRRIDAALSALGGGY